MSRPNFISKLVAPRPIGAGRSPTAGVLLLVLVLVLVLILVPVLRLLLLLRHADSSRAKQTLARTNFKLFLWPGGAHSFTRSLPTDSRYLRSRIWRTGAFSLAPTSQPASMSKWL